VSENGEGFGEEGVANEDSHAFAVDFVRGGATTTEGIIIHAGEVIVDEGIGVHDLDRAGGGEGIFSFASTSFGGGEGEDGAEAFATCEDGVAHALMNGFWTDGDAREEFVESVVDEDLLAFEVSFEIGHGGESIRNRGEGNRILQRSKRGLRWGHETQDNAVFADVSFFAPSVCFRDWSKASGV